MNRKKNIYSGKPFNACAVAIVVEVTFNKYKKNYVIKSIIIDYIMPRTVK